MRRNKRWERTLAKCECHNGSGLDVYDATWHNGVLDVADEFVVKFCIQRNF